MVVEYFYTKQAVGQLDLDDYSNCAIEANDDLGNFYYLIIQSEYGIANIAEFGPINEYEIPNIAYERFRRAEVNERKLEKVLNEFLNNDKRMITQAREISIEEARSKYKPILNYLDDRSYAE